MSTIEMLEFSIMNFNEKIEDFRGIASGMTLGSAEDMRKMMERFDWLDERGIHHMLTWKLIKTKNDVGGHFYRLTPCIWIFNNSDAMFFKLVWI